MVLINLQIAQEEQELREPPADVDRGQCREPFKNVLADFVH